SWREPVAPARKAAPPRDWAPVEHDLAAELAEMLSRPLNAPAPLPPQEQDAGAGADRSAAGEPAGRPPARHDPHPAWRPHTPGETEADGGRTERPDAQVIRRDVFRSTRAAAEPAREAAGDQPGSAPSHDRLAAMLEERQTARVMRSGPDAGRWQPPAPT